MYVGCRHTASEKKCKIQQAGSQETKDRVGGYPEETEPMPCYQHCALACMALWRTCGENPLRDAHCNLFREQIIGVDVIEMELNLSCLPDDTIHVPVEN